MSIPVRVAIGALLAYLVFNTAAWSLECDSRTAPDGEERPHLLFEGRHVPLYPAFEDYVFMMYDVCEAMGVWDTDECIIFPMNAEIGENAIATECDGGAIIVFDRRLSTQVGYEGALGIIAHEVAHHYCGHLRTSKDDAARNHQKELEADRFAGAAMKKLGYSIDQLYSYEPILSNYTSYSHPSRPRRLLALEEGWLNPDEALECSQ
jgi:hypothetical protein